MKKKSGPKNNNPLRSIIAGAPSASGNPLQSVINAAASKTPILGAGGVNTPKEMAGRRKWGNAGYGGMPAC